MKMLIKYVHSKPVSWQMDGTGTDVSIKFLGLRIAQWAQVFEHMRKTHETISIDTDIVTLEFYDD